MINLSTYIAHPERLNAETLTELRELLAEYPYHQPARLLYVRNLFLLHDPSFGNELRRSALYAPDRRVLFNMVEGRNYTLQHEDLYKKEETKQPQTKSERTGSLIDKFLEGIGDEPAQQPRRHATPIDATTDYTAILLQMDDAEEEKPEEKPEKPANRREELVQTFIDKGNGRITLKDEPEYKPEIEQESAQNSDIGEDCFTETLAKIYIRQGKYEKAIEILRKLNLTFPKRNAYFADQIRFLQKLIINNSYNKPAEG